MRRIGAITLAFITLAAALGTAQQPYGGAGGGGGRGGANDAPRMPSVEPLPTQEDLSGPAGADFIVDRFELDSLEAHAYRVAYDSFMTATQAVRDTALALRRRIDVLWQSGDRSTAQGFFPVLRQLGDVLSKEDGKFDDRLKKIFSKPHYKDYKDWRSDQRKQAEQDRKDRMKQMPGATSPGR